MKRPILVITIGYIIGILGANLHLILLPIIFLYPLIILILKIKKLYIKFYLKKSIILIFIISTIISNTITLILNYKYDNLYSNINEGEIEATIVSRKIEKEYKNVYKVKVNKINNNKKFKNTYLLLYTKKNINLNYGDLIKTNIVYEKPSIQRNYKGFNYKEYLKTIKVYGLATAEKKVKIIKSKNINYIYYYCNALNEKLQENINKHFSKETASVLIGMVLGEKQFIEEDITQSFKKSSLSHILAISGAHVNYVIVLISFIVSKTRIANRKGKIISVIFLLFFMVLTGMQISVIRAVISSCLIIIASLLYRQFDTINSVCFSMLIILLLNPFNINSLSLQLSFGGTLGIILFLEFLYKRNENKIIDYIKSAIEFDAVVTSDDSLAAGAVKYAHSHSISVPDELEIIGFNNSVLSICTEPELTSIDSHVEQLSTKAVDVLMKVLCGESADKHSIITADIIKRNTTHF